MYIHVLLGDNDWYFNSHIAQMFQYTNFDTNALKGIVRYKVKGIPSTVTSVSASQISLLPNIFEMHFVARTPDDPKNDLEHHKVEGTPCYMLAYVLQVANFNLF